MLGHRLRRWPYIEPTSAMRNLGDQQRHHHHTNECPPPPARGVGLESWLEELVNTILYDRNKQTEINNARGHLGVI